MTYPRSRPAAATPSQTIEFFYDQPTDVAASAAIVYPTQSTILRQNAGAPLGFTVPAATYARVLIVRMAGAVDDTGYVAANPVVTGSLSAVQTGNAVTVSANAGYY